MMKQNNLQASSSPDLIELLIAGDQKNRQLKDDGHTFGTLSKLITDVGRSCKMKSKKNKGNGRIDKGSNSFKSRFGGLASKSGLVFTKDNKKNEMFRSKGECNNFSCSEDEVSNGLRLRKCKSEDDLSFFHTVNFSTSQDVDLNHLDNGEDGSGADSFTGVSGTKKTTDVSNWLLMNYERTSDDSAIARMDLYEHYKNNYLETGRTPVCQATFGKVIRLVFPGMKDRRLGIRGKSRYHYCGIRPYLSIELKLQVAKSLRKNLDNIINQYEKKLLNSQNGVTKSTAPPQQAFSSLYIKESDAGYTNSNTINENIYNILSNQQAELGVNDNKNSAYTSPSSCDSDIISFTESKTSLTNNSVKVESSPNSNNISSNVNGNNSDFYLSNSSSVPKTGMARVINICPTQSLPRPLLAVNVLKSDNQINVGNDVILGNSKNNNELEVDNKNNILGTFNQHHNHNHNHNPMDVNNSQTRGQTISTTSNQLKQFHLSGICSPMYVEHENNKTAAAMPLIMHGSTSHQHNNINHYGNGQLGVSQNVDLDLYCMNDLTNPNSNLGQANSFDYLSILESDNSVNNISISHTTAPHTAAATQRNQQFSHQHQIERESSVMMTS